MNPSQRKTSLLNLEISIVVRIVSKCVTRLRRLRSFGISISIAFLAFFKIENHSSNVVLNRGDILRRYLRFRIFSGLSFFRRPFEPIPKTYHLKTSNLLTAQHTRPNLASVVFALSSFFAFSSFPSPFGSSLSISEQKHPKVKKLRTTFL